MKRLLLIGLGAALIATIIGLAMYHKPHQSMTKAKPDYTLSAQALFSEYEADEANSNKKYLDKVIIVSGEVLTSDTESDQTRITLDAGGMLGGVICQLDPLSEHSRTSFSPGESVGFKGLCTGMLMDVVLVRCIEVK